MGYFKNLDIERMNREADALEKLYKLQYRFAERSGIDTLLLFSSHSAESLLRCIYFWLSYKCRRFREEKYPDRISWFCKNREFFIRIAGQEVLCDDTPVTSFSEFLEWHESKRDKLKYQKQ